MLGAIKVAALSMIPLVELWWLGVSILKVKDLFPKSVFSSAVPVSVFKKLPLALEKLRTLLPR